MKGDDRCGTREALKAESKILGKILNLLMQMFMHDELLSVACNSLLETATAVTISCELLHAGDNCE